MKSRGLVFVGPRCPWGPIYGSGSETPFADLTDDVTLADKDTNSILTDNANREIQGNVAMQVMQTGGAVWWPNLKPIQVFHNGPTQLSLKWIQTQFVQQDNSS